MRIWYVGVGTFSATTSGTRWIINVWLLLLLLLLVHMMMVMMLMMSSYGDPSVLLHRLRWRRWSTILWWHNAHCERNNVIRRWLAWPRLCHYRRWIVRHDYPSTTVAGLAGRCKSCRTQIFTLSRQQPTTEKQCSQYKQKYYDAANQYCQHNDWQTPYGFRGTGLNWWPHSGRQCNGLVIESMRWAVCNIFRPWQHDVWFGSWGCWRLLNKHCGRLDYQCVVGHLVNGRAIFLPWLPWRQDALPLTD